MAGATVAKYLRRWGPNLDVTLVEPQSAYVSCILSSLVLTGQRTLDNVTFGYDTLASAHGVRVVHDQVVEVDPVSVKVQLAGGSILAADRIVLAPGIAFDNVPGLTNPDAMPHAWKAGQQTTQLAAQLQSMPSGGRVLLTVPRTPYRCPPGPYERACLLAAWLTRNKPGSKLIVLDANADFVTEKDNFSNAFFGLHGSVIEYHTNAEILSADPATMTLQTTLGAMRGDVINLIPRQRAGDLITQTSLNNSADGRFAGVDVLSYASTTRGADAIHVIGDSSATTQPKAGHIANQEAKICADAIVKLLSGEQPDAAPVTNSACFSTITMAEASWLTAVFQYDPITRSMKPVAASSTASAGWSSENFQDMNTWFRSLMSDTFA